MNTAERAKAMARLQSHLPKIRNVCVLAHVDHGKTTLTDSLVASNGIISERIAGKVRYLDRREDEQVRGITMEAHGVSLVYKDEYLINLIDSPGHVDFSADVSSAVRLCDGAYLVVDVVEGVCVQTHAVARVAWEEGLRPCLVLNKVDRLCTELKLTIEEANDHLHRTLEQVNALLSGFIRAHTDDEDEIEKMENEYLFAPERGNVVFSSGTDAWAFSLLDFAPMIAKLLVAEESEVLGGLWGMDKFWDAKNKRVISGGGGSQPPMFANYILRNIWQVYEVVFADPAKPKKLANILDVLGIGHVLTQAQSKDKKSAIRAVMGAWLPCARAMMEMVVRCVPDPHTAQMRRARLLLPHSSVEAQDVAFKAVESASSDGPLVCFVSKMIAVPVASLPASARLRTEEDEENCFIALGRVFSGTLTKGHALYVVGPKGVREDLPEGTRIQPLLLMGGDFLEIDRIPTGNVFALAGLGSVVQKTATLIDIKLEGCPSLTKMPAQSAPLLRVSIEPTDPRNWDKLQKGLKLLNRADPVLEVRVTPSGEHLICAIGELHLERCLKDLREIFAKVEFRVSEPLASFRETLVHRNGNPSHATASSLSTALWGVHVNLNPVRAAAKDELHATVVNFCGPLGQVVIKMVRSVAVRAYPLPESVVSEMEAGTITVEGSNTKGIPASEHFEVLATNGNGNTLMIEGKAIAMVRANHTLRDAMVSGFQLACRAGPLCEEPLRGVSFIVEHTVDDDAPSEADGNISSEVEGGALVSSFADAVKRAFKVHCEPPATCHANLGSRLVEAIFKCSLHCLAEGEQLGNLYSVVSRRRGKVTSEGMVDGTSLFQIEALIPVVEAYGIADELRKKTSGNVSSPQLVFSHWEVLDVDPFFKNKTEDELEDNGETVLADRENNLAYKLMTSVRKRKGLQTGEKVVAAAEKQRTLSRKA